MKANSRHRLGRRCAGDDDVPVLLSPVLGNHFGRSGEPFFIVSTGLDLRHGKIFRSICRGASQGLQQTSSNEHGNVMILESQQDSDLFDAQSCGKPGYVQDFEFVVAAHDYQLWHHFFKQRGQHPRKGVLDFNR